MRHWLMREDVDPDYDEKVEKGGRKKKPKPGAPADDEDVDENEQTKKRKYPAPDDPLWAKIIEKLNARN
jgi:hypothetical protein